MLDREALRQYRQRLADLDDELDAAALRGDRERQEERTAERDALIAELKRATGLGGRPRRSGSPAEKARLNVTRTIRHAITDLATRAPDPGGAPGRVDRHRGLVLLRAPGRRRLDDVTSGAVRSERTAPRPERTPSS